MERTSSKAGGGGGLGVGVGDGRLGVDAADVVGSGEPGGVSDGVGLKLCRCLARSIL